MAIPQDVREVLGKVFKKIKENPRKLIDIHSAYFGKRDEAAYTVENLEAIACNHLFDDNHEDYGISEREGCVIRHYFSTGADTYNFISDLRQEFPDFFSVPESEEYLNLANAQRESKGLSQLEL